MQAFFGRLARMAAQERQWLQGEVLEAQLAAYHRPTHQLTSIRMTQGRCGSLLHIRVTLSFTTPHWFNRRTRRRLMCMPRQLLVAAFLLCALSAPDKEIKRAPARPTSAASAKKMFVSYCAVCQQGDGKGGDPAASALKDPRPI
jgi:hypothetical protein